MDRERKLAEHRKDLVIKGGQPKEREALPEAGRPFPTGHFQGLPNGKELRTLSSKCCGKKKM